MATTQHGFRISESVRRKIDALLTWIILLLISLVSVAWAQDQVLAPSDPGDQQVQEVNQEPIPAPPIVIPPRAAGQRKPSNAPATAPLGRQLTTLHPNIWITDVNSDRSHSPQNYRIVGSQGGDPFLVDFSYITSEPVDVELYINGQLMTVDCTWGSGQGTCYGLIPVNSGKFVVQVFESYFFGQDYSPPINIFLNDYPHPGSCPLMQSGQGTGDPIDVVFGKLWYEYADFQMSGPFGLSFTRWYDSQSNFSGDLGFGWRHNYGAYLDLSEASQGIVILQNEQDQTSWFCIVAPGVSFYDNFTGALLGLSADGRVYTLTTWHGTVEKFDSSGRLASITDRIGNTQVIARDSGHNNRISSVTDALGRSLAFGYDSSNRITSVNSTPSGISLGLTYDNCGTGNLCSATESDGNTWTYQYTDVSPHNLTKVVDPLGNPVETITYHGNKVASQSTGTGENSLSFTYSSQSQTVVTDGLGRTTTFGIDPYLLLVTSINGPLCNCGGGTMRSFTYDSFLRKTSQTDGNGSTHTISWVYGNDVVTMNPDGSQYIITAYPAPTQIIEPLSSGVNRITNITYYPIGDPRQDLANVITIPSADTPGQNKTVTSSFNTQGLLTSQAVQGYVGGVSTTYTTSSTYDSKGRLMQFTGPRTDVVQKTTYAYFPDTDSDLARRGQLSTVTDALNHLTAYASDASPYNTYTLYGEAKSITDPNGVVIDSSYDLRGRLLSKTIKGVPSDPSPLTTSLVYDLAGKLTAVTKPLLNGLNMVYDASNRLTSGILTAGTTNFQEERVNFGYDVMSQKISEQAQVCANPSVSCPSWTTTESESFEYDGDGRLTEVDHPVPIGSKIVYGYDGAGNLTSVQDENHGSANATMTYDYANRMVSLTQTLAGAPGGTISTLYGYDIQNNLNSVTDPNANLTAYSFDDFRRIRMQNSPVGGLSTYTYDPADNLTTFGDANGANTARTYDALDRILSSVSTRSGVPPETVSWTYDDTVSGHFGIGRIATLSDPTGSASYTYDRRGLFTSEARIILGNGYNLAYTYDGNGNRNSLTYPDGKVVNYAFDWADRPISAISGSMTLISSAMYEPFGPLTQLAFGNGTTQTITYDPRYRPLENKLVKNGNLADYLYAEDPVGNVTQIHDVLNAGYNRDLGYDDLNRLTMANSGSLLWGSSGNGYTYDSMGNIKTLKLGSELASFAYSGALPLLTSVAESGKPHAGARGVNYDAVGNELAVGPPGGRGSLTIPYSYTPRNLLASGDGFQYIYDGWNRRTVTSAIGGATRYSFYGPGGLLLSESAISSSGRPAIAFDYVWFGDRPVAQIDNIETHWTFADHLGTPLIQTDSSGSISYQAEYEPYGEIFALRAGDVHQPIRFPGQVAEQFDLGANGATERSYNLFRWYRPGWGRYTQQDPLSKILPVWQDSRYSSVLYGYAASNPLFFTDITGLAIAGSGDECCDCPGGGWRYLGGSVGGGGFVIGGSFSRGTYTCQTRPDLQVPVKSKCLTAGLQTELGVNACVNFSIPGVPSAKECRVKDLFGPSNSFSPNIPIGPIGIGGDWDPKKGTFTFNLCIGKDIKGTSPIKFRKNPPNFFGESTCTTTPDSGGLIFLD